MSIRARLLLIALIATLVPALLAAQRFLQDRDTALALNGRRLSAMAQTLVDTLRDRVQGTAQLQFGLARARDLDTRDRAACSTFLSEVRETYPQYTGILTIQPDGHLFCDSLRSGRELDLNNRAYFQRARAGEAGPILEPTFGRLTGMAVLQVAYPVRSTQGELRFVLLASLNLQKLAQVEPYLVSGARLLVTDQRGLVLVNTTPIPGMAPGESIGETPLFRFATATGGPATADLAMPDGQAYQWTRADTSGVAGAGLVVLAGAPRDGLAAAANRRFRQDLALAAAVAASLFLALWFLTELALRRPIRRIVGLAERLADGDLGARIEGPLPRGELGHLMTVLNRTADALQSQREDIEQLNLRLTQSQRLEAVGQLTGGVAHDFNNLLTVVLGNAELLVEQTGDDALKHQLAQMIRAAALRGAGLTRQLLAFARKQALAPAPVDVGQLVRALEPMLARTLGEHIRIEVEGGGAWPAMVDPGQLENALLNLCLNARDAMPGGGRLTMSIENATLAADQAGADVQAGDYVLLKVCDTGHGIAPEHLGKVFEPFFTTKARGKGTGLGLAMVYGFLKQSGGHVAVESRVDAGTCVKLYLPRAASAPAVPAPPPDEVPAPAGGHETVLVVEDEALVRRYACSELQRLGYRVLEADGGDSAMAFIDAGEDIDLLFTDVVMPGLSGPELAAAVRLRRPGMPVLFTSGYNEEAFGAANGNGPEGPLLSKPYHRADLARMVRQALAGAPG
ncbi:MAG: ATP-binding protein [Burkholderiaceae bacterium]